MTSRAVVLGDSTSHHVGVGNAGLDRVTWAQRVADAAGLHLDVHAQSGASTVEIERDLLPDVSGQYDLGLCLVGINDVKQVRVWDPAAYRRRLSHLLDTLHNHAERVAVLTLPANVGTVPTVWPYGPGMRRRVRAANRIITDVAREHGSIVVELPALRLRSECGPTGGTRPVWVTCTWRGSCPPRSACRPRTRPRCR